MIVFRLRDMRPENVNRHLEQVLDQHLDALAQGAVVSVGERHIRLRLLPIAPAD